MLALATDLTRNLLATVILLLLAIGSLWVLEPFLPAIVWAATIVVSTWTLMRKLQHRFNDRRALAVTCMMVVMALLVILPIAATFSTLASHTDDAINWIRDLPQKQIPPAPEWLAKTPIVGQKISSDWNRLASSGYAGMAAYVQPYVRATIRWILEQAGNMGLFFLHLLLTLAFCGIFYAKGEVAAQGLIRFSRRLAKDRGEAAVILAGQAIKAVAMGIVITALVQSALGGLGLWIAGIPFAGVITAVMFAFCIAQLGPAIPLLAAVGWLFANDQKMAGGILLVWSILVSTLDNVMRPLLIKKGADLPLLLILVGVIGGLMAFGVMGLFMGPVLLAITYTLLKAWVNETQLDDLNFVEANTPPPRDERSIEL
jgi:predicted PurR-regulated permease PerM